MHEILKERNVIQPLSYLSKTAKSREVKKKKNKDIKLRYFSQRECDMGKEVEVP